MVKRKSKDTCRVETTAGIQHLGNERWQYLSVALAPWSPSWIQLENFKYEGGHVTYRFILACS